MAGSSVGSTITASITLGVGYYATPLTIIPSGDIAPIAESATGLLAVISGGSVGNSVGIMGGPAAYGAGGYAVVLTDGSLSNGGTITGGAGESGGIGVVLAGGNMSNDGTIAGGPYHISPVTANGSGGIGVYFASGSLVNTGIITGGSAGIAIGGTGVDLRGGSLVNAGTISGGMAWKIDRFGGQGGIGVALRGGSLTNDGSIVGGTAMYGGAGVYLTGGSLTNNGTITAEDGGDAVDVTAGDLTNSAVIASGVSSIATRGGIGVHLTGGSLNNAGTVTGGTGGAAGIKLIFHNPQVYVPGFPGGNGVDLSGGSLVNIGTITGGAGGAASSSLNLPGGKGGTGVYFHGGGTLTNAGLITGGAGTAGEANAVYFGTGTSRLILAPGASFNGAVVANPGYNNIMDLMNGSGPGTIASLGETITGFGTIDFAASASWLIAGNTAGLAGGQIIQGFTSGDTIELTGFVATAYSFTGSGLVLSDGPDAETIAIQGMFASQDFNVFSDAGNSFVEIALPCFAAGTRIDTEQGEIAVELLRAGDKVCVLLGDRVAEVTWIGRRVVNCARHHQPRHVWPVRVAANAFGPARPCRDLLLSPNHAVFVDGVLIPIKYLINGTTIGQVPVHEVTYYHIELGNHDVLFAEGLPCESYLDTGKRPNFENADGLVTLHPDFSARAWEAEGCAPLVVTGRLLDAVRARLNARAVCAA